ncbi:Poly(U)-specific endoribonuclease [Strongyloides ratti]|uniref:Endoribonuclease n=1 Tax=Strongyloides ratti TaxID=34506 RepID=A0A090N024_STRRB|nr:Poly(U)-specific endoribonuclease [Strongyloides ratti]CEF69940.1 Poly(U)-specific endoribonuclease [Strongyloides ratti]
MPQPIFPEYSSSPDRNILPRISTNIKGDYKLINIKMKKKVSILVESLNILLAFITFIILSIIFYQLLIYYLTSRNNTLEKIPLNNNETFENLILRLNDIDEDKPKEEDIIISWGNLIKHSGTSKIQKPLFTYVNEDLFKRPVYKSLIDIYNNLIFRPPVCKEDLEIEGKKKKLIDNFLNVYTNTTIFKMAYKYLVDTYKISNEWNNFYNRLHVFWFGTYSRCHGALGSSGWEHVFSGEWKNDEIDGHHNWIRYYLLQQENRIKYYGHMGHTGNVTGKIQYTWDGYLKKVGGFFMKTSPSFDFTVLTLCSLPEYGKRLCHFKIYDYDIVVTSFHQKCLEGICLSTAYPS